MEFNEEEYLQLSGIQHFLFCRRQWALIHIEQQWQESFRTADGRVMHDKVHDPEFRTLRGDILTVRAMRIHSSKLGISGECDAVEFHMADCGIPIAKTKGLWIPYPVEYKRGGEKHGQEDEAQLCAQAMCLEEMLCCDVPAGALYYGELRHRKDVVFTKELRELTCKTIEEMHELYKRGSTPKVKPAKSCNACSLKELCLPKLMKKEKSVDDYLKSAIGDS